MVEKIEITRTPEEIHMAVEAILFNRISNQEDHPQDMENLMRLAESDVISRQYLDALRRGLKVAELDGALLVIRWLTGSDANSFALAIRDYVNYLDQGTEKIQNRKTQVDAIISDAENEHLSGVSYLPQV